MKRLIICKACIPEHKAGHPQPCPYPVEHTKLVECLALRPYVCDSCNAQIKPYETCAASSFWADHAGQPYYQLILI